MFDFVDKPEYWNERYRNSKANWDMKSATPIFIDILKEGKIIQPGKIFIAGSGKGYDAVAAAKFGYEVTAIDFSSEAIAFSQKLAAVDNVRINFITENIFTLDQSFENSFDVVYEYVTYCSINPERHEEYIRKLSSFIKPGGKLIALLFPVENVEGGPPFGVDPVEFFSIAKNFLILEQSTKIINSIKPRKGREVLQVYSKLT